MAYRNLPLTTEILNEYKDCIRWQAEQYQSKEIEIGTVLSRGGRGLVKHQNYPTKEAFEFFQNEGAGRIVTDWLKMQQGLPMIFEITDPGYFEIDYSSLEWPLTFSVDEKIKTDLISMVDIYAQIYDIENRIRHFLHECLCSKYGSSYYNNLSKSVKNSIDNIKSRTALYIDDQRTYLLQYTNFDDLKHMIQNEPDFITKTPERKKILDEIAYLFEVRNHTAHNVRINSEEIRHIRKSCDIVRRILV